MSKSQTYNRSLDELLGFNTANSRSSYSVPLHDKYPPKAVSHSSDTKLVVSRDRPITRHGRSSQSESSSSSKTENSHSEPKFGRRNNVDVWNRDEEVNSTSITANRSRPSTLTHSLQQPTTIIEQDQPSSVGSSSVSSDQSLFQDEVVVEPKPENFETSMPPFKLTSSSSATSSQSNLSGVSQRTYDTKVNNNDENPLNSSLKLTGSLLSLDFDKQIQKEVPEVTEQKSAVSSIDGSAVVRLAKESSQPVVLSNQNRTIDSKPLVNEKERARSATKSLPKPCQRPKSSVPQPKSRPSTEYIKLKSSISTRQLINNNGSNYNLWFQRSLANERQKRVTLAKKQAEEEQKKAEQKANAERAFERWKAEHERKRAEQRLQQKQKQKELEQQKRVAAEEKRQAAEKVFEHWKQTQEEKRRVERLQRLNEQRARTHSAEEQKRRQRAENDKAYKLWCETLNERMREDKMIRKAEEEKCQAQLDQDKQFRESLAKEAYHLWLEMKRKEKILSNSLAYKIIDYNAKAKKQWPVPWIPTTPTVPRKFVGTGNRRRTLDKPLSIVQKRARSTN